MGGNIVYLSHIITRETLTIANKSQCIMIKDLRTLIHHFLLFYYLSATPLCFQSYSASFLVLGISSYK